MFLRLLSLIKWRNEGGKAGGRRSAMGGTSLEAAFYGDSKYHYSTFFAFFHIRTTLYLLDRLYNLLLYLRLDQNF